MTIFVLMLSLFVPIHLSLDILIFGILVMGYNFIFGHMGLLSFGHAMFFGIGAYSTGFILSNYYEGWLVLFIGGGIAAILAIAVGYVCLKRFGSGTDPAYLALTTMAFSQMIYFICLSPLREYTGGSDGILGISTPPFTIPGIFSISLDSPLRLYFVILGVFILCVFLMRCMIYSRFGRVIHAIRENERRVEFLGYNPFLFKLIAFVLSGFFGGIAGSLYAIRLNYVGLETLYWLMSGEIVIMCLIGGMKTFWGPLIGTAIFLIFKDMISNYTQEWLGFIAVMIIVVVLFSPSGIWGRLEKSFLRIQKR